MYTLANMQDSIKKVEATRAQRMATEPRRMTADEKDALLAAYHPDYKEEGFITGPKADIDRVVNTYLSKYEIHLENALTELSTMQNITPYIRFR